MIITKYLIIKPYNNRSWPCCAYEHCVPEINDVGMAKIHFADLKQKDSNTKYRLIKREYYMRDDGGLCIIDPICSRCKSRCGGHVESSIHSSAYISD